MSKAKREAEAVAHREAEARAREVLQATTRRIHADRMCRAWERAAWRHKYIADAVSAALR